MREDYESKKWFGGNRALVADFAPVKCFMSINEEAALVALRQEAADFAVVFGTSRLKPNTIDACPPTLLNLHGGDSQKYRGLDSHLWAIYRRDFESLKVTLHRVDVELDTGEIVAQSKVPIENGMHIHALRASTTELCAQMTLGAAENFLQEGEVTSRPQTTKGDYYSAMPVGLKGICEQNFSHFTRSVCCLEA